MADRVGVIDKGRILLVEEKSTLMARMGRTEAIFTLARPLPGIPTALERFGLHLSDDGAVLTYRGGDGEGEGKREVAELTKALVAQGIDFAALDLHESSLEDIFVDLVENDR